MSRIVKAHDERRQEILQTAQRLFYTKGYDQTSIQDIIDAVGIAKGTFYHYFGSKSELLNELVEQLLVEALQHLEPLVQDGEPGAIEKFNRFFREALTWKTQHREFLLGMLRSYYSDDNAVLREKLTRSTLQAVAPLLTKLIQQGVAEGVFDVESPEETASIVLSMGQWWSDTVGHALLETAGGGDLLQRIEGQLDALHQAIERVLGAPRGSLRLIDKAALREWVTPSSEEIP
ncbi:MAG: TetR/AcrR family transcriptional regulator [Anaerolineae bacterium]